MEAVRPGIRAIVEHTTTEGARQHATRSRPHRRQRPEASKQALEILGQQGSKVLNIFGEIAHASALLKLYANAEQLLQEEPSLDA